MNSLSHRTAEYVLKCSYFFTEHLISVHRRNSCRILSANYTFLPRLAFVACPLFSSTLIRAVSTMNVRSSKPPNILVLSDNVAQFETAKSVLTSVGFSQSHCVYQLESSGAKSQLWVKNCRLLVVMAENADIDGQVRDNIDEFVSANGHILSFSRSLFQSRSATPLDSSATGTAVIYDRTFDPVLIDFHPVISDSLNLAVDASTNAPLVQSFNISQGAKIVVSGIPLLNSCRGAKPYIAKNHDSILSLILERFFSLRRYETDDNEQDNALKWTPIFLMGIDQAALSEFARVLRDLEKRGRLRNLSLVDKEASCEDTSDDKIPVILDAENPAFQANTFHHHLNARFLARVVLFAEVLPTTMTILDPVLPHLPPGCSAVVVASRQSSGLGRGGNAWLSPVGCAMFTLHLPLSMDTELGRRVSIIQHLVALSIVESVVERSGYEDVDARIKWPNDVLHGETHSKLGGILVKSSIMGKNIQCSVGCGVNLFNGKPTTCLNDLAVENAPDSNLSVDGGRNLMSTEEFIARVVSKLESILIDFEDSVEREKIFQRYYRHWLHSEQEVTIDGGGRRETVMARIAGIDEYGFLRAIVKADGREITLHPDGNSFDLFRNLIVAK